jgi:hypothetical protein
MRSEQAGKRRRGKSYGDLELISKSLEKTKADLGEEILQKKRILHV